MCAKLSLELLRWAQSMDESLVGLRLKSSLDNMFNLLWHHRDAIDDWANAQAQVAT